MGRRNKSQTQVVSGKWIVSVTSHSGKHVLNVHRRIGDKLLPGDANGREFPSVRTAYEFAYDRGYIQSYFPSREARVERLGRIAEMGLVHYKSAGGQVIVVPPDSLSRYKRDGARYFCGSVEVTQIVDKMIEFAVGTKVRYAQKFCERTGSFMRHDGVVLDLLVMRPTQLAVAVEWPDGSMQSVNTDNLLVKETSYRGFQIMPAYPVPPIPVRDFDWQWLHEDYDGTGDNRRGSAAGVVECKTQIDEFLDN